MPTYLLHLITSFRQLKLIIFYKYTKGKPRELNAIMKLHCSVCVCALQASQPVHGLQKFQSRSNGHCQIKGKRMGVNYAATLCLKCKAQHDLPRYLIVTLLGQNPAFPHHHPDSNQSHQDSMAKIPKHDSKQEWEGDDGIGCCKGKDNIMLLVSTDPPWYTPGNLASIIPQLPLCY